MSDRSPAFAEVIQRGVLTALKRANVALPGRVEKYDPATQLIDAKPLIQEPRVLPDGSEVYDALPVITNVPVVFAGGGGFRATFPVQRGDTVLLVFSQRSMDEWLASGGDVQPQDGRLHAFDDAIAIPGLHPTSAPWTGASTSKATFGKDGGPQLVATPAGVELGSTDETPATEAVLLGTSFRADQAALHAEIATTLATVVTQLGIAGAQLSAAGPSIIIPSAGIMVAAAGAALTSAVAAVGAIEALITDWEAVAVASKQDYLSTKATVAQ